MASFTYNNQHKVEEAEKIFRNKFPNIDTIREKANKLIDSYPTAKEAYLAIDGYVEENLPNELCNKYISVTRQGYCMYTFESNRKWITESMRAEILSKSNNSINLCDLQSGNSKLVCIIKAARSEEDCLKLEPLGGENQLFYCYESLLQNTSNNCSPNNIRCSETTSNMRRMDKSFCDRYVQTVDYSYKECVQSNGEQACTSVLNKTEHYNSCISKIEK